MVRGRGGGGLSVCVCVCVCVCGGTHLFRTPTVTALFILQQGVVFHVVL